MTRAHARTALALVVAAALFAGAASAQAVRYTVEILGANDQVAALDSFRGGDLLDVRVGLHNASDRVLEPGSVWIVVPPAEGIRTQIATAGLAYTDPERYVDASGREAAGFEANLTAFYPALVDPLPPGANHHVRIRLSVVSSANGLAGLVDALRLNNRFDRTIGTRVDELPAPVAAPAAAPAAAAGTPANANIDAVAEHIATMFGHLGAVRYPCPAVGSDPARTICGEVDGSFRQVQQMWDLYFDWASETPVTATALDSWSRDDSDLYTRVFEVGGEPFVVAYYATDDNAGVLTILIGR